LLNCSLLRNDESVRALCTVILKQTLRETLKLGSLRVANISYTRTVYSQ